MLRVGAPPRSASNPLSPEAERFGAALASLGGGTPLLLAVSGGPDSMAMLTLATEALPGGVAAATVDHGLRAESADEALAVARHCGRVGVPHATLRPDRAIEGASLQAQARAARYELLAEEARRQGATAIVTAHHADDAAETFLMRAARGSGLAGLAGVRARTVIDGAAVIRPLLDWRRAELRAVVRRAGVPFIDDPSNSDDRHDRTRFRRLLEANEWLDPPHLAASAAALAEVDRDVRLFAEWFWSRYAEVSGGAVRLSVDGLPRELRRRLLRRAIASVRELAKVELPAWSDSANIEPLLDALEAGRRGTQAGLLVSPRADGWYVRVAPPRRSR